MKFTTDLQRRRLIYSPRLQQESNHTQTNCDSFWTFTMTLTHIIFGSAAVYQPASEWIWCRAVCRAYSRCSKEYSCGVATTWSKTATHRMVAGSGGAQWVARQACAPAVNPCTPAVPRQASRRHFILLFSSSFLRFIVLYFTPTETNFLPLMASQNAVFWKQISKNFPGLHSGPPCGRGLSHPATTPSRGFGPDYQPQQNYSMLCDLLEKHHRIAASRG